MTKTLVGLVMVATVLLIVSPARAQQDFATQNTVAFSADRLFGFYGYTRTTEYNPPNQPYKNKYTESGTQLGFLLGNSTTNGSSPAQEPNVNPFVIPRFGIDFFPIDGLSIGGSIGYVSVSSEQKSALPPAQTVNFDNDSISAFLFAPRVGYAIMFGDIFGIWPRGGFSYVWIGREVTQGAVTVDASTSYFDLDIEFQLILSPVNHFAFTLGPVIDIGLLGGHDVVFFPGAPQPPYKIDADSRFTTYGFTFGLMGYI